MLPVRDALKIVLSTASLTAGEELPLADALGRVLRSPVVAAADDPPFAKSAVDGYCLDEACRARLPGEHEVAGVVQAGDRPPGRLHGRAMKVMTGAPIPPDGAAMVMVEESEARPGGKVLLRRPVQPGAGILQAGENHLAGTPLLPAGLRLAPAHLGIAAHAGAGAVRVAARAPLTLIPTGNELVLPGVTPGPGQIVNSSAPALLSLLALSGAAAALHPIVGDDPDALAAAISAAGGDVVLTGGVSMGDADFLPGVIARLGFETRFHKVAMKPGKPLLFCTHPDGRRLFGLPGNPVSSLLAARLFICPWLLLRLGATPPPARRGRLSAAAHGAGERAHFLPVQEKYSGADFTLAPLPGRGSADLAAYRSADGVAVVPPGVDSLAAGEVADYLPLDPWAGRP
jgi:molybdopterin molybdotransferase